jgi:ribonuclease HI
MELQAVIAGLGLVPEDAQVLVYTDSQYAYHAILGDWCVEKNDDLIVELYLLLEKRHVSACYIPRGSTREQKRVDREAKTASQDCPKLVLLPDKNQQKSHS